MEKFIIAITALAQSGKDSFAIMLKRELASRGIDSWTCSFAKQLKLDVKDFAKEKYGLDVFDDRSKNKIRPLLVFHGNYMRGETNGTYWVENIKKEIFSNFLADFKVILISDVRFKEFEYDELDFVKDNGILVHIKKYGLIEWHSHKIYSLPPNDSEAKNDPVMEQNADYKIEWQDYQSQATLFEKEKPTVEKFVDWLFEHPRFKEVVLNA